MGKSGRKWLFFLGFLMAISGVLVLANFRQKRVAHYPSPSLTVVTTQTFPKEENPLAVFRNPAFVIEGRTVQLTDGRAVERVPGASGPRRTGLTTFQAVGDIDGDGISDAASVVVSEAGPLDARYYLVAILRSGTSDSKGKAANTIHIGNSILVEQLTIRAGEIAVDYRELKANGTPDSRRTFRCAMVEGVLVPRE